jgi:hypothetical protein
MDTKKILWANVSSLMLKKYGEVNLYRTHIDSMVKGKELSISIGSLQRIKSCKTATGIDTVEKIAFFFNLQAWQLLCPLFDPTSPPELKETTKVM